MHSTLSLPRERPMPQKLSASALPATVETRVWAEEHHWLHGLFKSSANVAPTFRFPDLISACVTLAFTAPAGSAQLFTYMRTRLALRDQRAGGLRKEDMWRQQYQLLLAAQRSPDNQHPNPNFQLDQFTTACIALARARDEGGTPVLHQARLNLAERTSESLIRSMR